MDQHTHDTRAARDELLTAALKLAAHRIYDEWHPDNPHGDAQAELDEGILTAAARAFVQALDPVKDEGTEVHTEYRLWRRQDDGTVTGLGTSYELQAFAPFLLHPHRWLVRYRTVRTHRGVWADLPPEHPDVAAYLAECAAAGEAPEHDGAPS